jgi:hypothetical protein
MRELLFGVKVRSHESGTRPFVFANLKSGEGVDRIASY